MTARSQLRPQPLSTTGADLIRRIGRFADAAEQESDLSRLGRLILTTSAELLDHPDAALWTKADDGSHYRLLTTIGRRPAASWPDRLAPDHAPPTDSGTLVLLQQDALLRTTPIGSAMTALNAAACLVIPQGAEPTGLCLFGPRETTHPLTEEESAAADTIARLAGAKLAQHPAHAHRGRHSALMRRTDRLHSLEIMAGGFAHEIRNPLTSIKTFIQLAQLRRHDAAFMTEFSRLAIEDVHRIEALLHEILDYASHVVPQPAEVDLNDVVASCLSFIASAAAHRGTELRSVPAPNLPLLWLDRRLIKQMLLNLLLNALEASAPHGGAVEIRTRLQSSADGSTWVRVEVEDHGCGIAPEHLEHIFDPFFTTKQTNSDADGSGLGLTIAHQIVREQGGTLTVDSRVGVGSTFIVTLPASSGRPTLSAVRE